MAVTYKDTEPKPQVAKRNIKIDGVSIENNQLIDEEGNIANRLADILPNGVDEFTLKITIVLPDED